MSGPDPIDPIEEEDAAIMRLYEENKTLRLAVARLTAELAEAKGKLCRAREALVNRGQPHWARIKDIDASLSSSAPCEHAAREKVLEEENEKLRVLAHSAEVVNSRLNLELNFVSLLKVVTAAFAVYKERHPRWWARMDRTPIVNDLPVIIAEELVRRRAVSAFVKGGGR